MGADYAFFRLCGMEMARGRQKKEKVMIAFYSKLPEFMKALIWFFVGAAFHAIF